MLLVRSPGASLGLTALLLAIAPSMPDAAPRSAGPILIQGALQMETTQLIGQLRNGRTEVIGPWTFVRGTVDGYPVVVSRTRMGGVHAAAATTAAIEHYRPIAIFNQGTAGGHDPSLRVGDIVLGTHAVGIAAFRTPGSAAGAGSRPLEWKAVDLMERKGDEDGALHEGEFLRIAADAHLLDVARGAGRDHRPGRVVEGIIGTGEVWNEEVDRVAWLRRTFGTSVEEMETAASAQIARLYGVPFLGVRVVTANVTNGGTYDPVTADVCQNFTMKVVRAYIADLRRPKGPVGKR